MPKIMFKYFHNYMHRNYVHVIRILVVEYYLAS